MRVVYMFPCFLIFSTLLWSVALPSPSQLALPAGLRLSLLDSYKQTPNGYYKPVSPNKFVAAQAYGGGFFFPILSTKAFTTPGGNRGFSFGFLFAPHNYDAQQASDIYLSVCIGKLGSEVVYVEDRIVYGWADSKGKPIKPSYTFDGFAMPVWIANLDRPLRSFKGSLMVDKASKDLQMKDSNGSVVWNVTSVGMMEMLETGNLRIYDTTNTTIVWQSFQQRTDTLVANQPLNASMQLVSNASSFLIRMEPGGLVFYLNSQFPGSLSYWIIPVINSMNVTESPCSDNSAYAYLDPRRGLMLVPGTCNNAYSTWIYLQNNSQGTPYIVLKLENDGRAYLYIFDPDTNKPSRLDPGLDNGVLYYTMTNSSRNNSWTVLGNKSVETSNVSAGSSSTVPYTIWGSCDIPMACGPLSICTPHVEDPCTCPLSSEEEVPTFNPVDPNYMSQGCKRSMSLPPCGMMGGDNGSTTFLEINRTGSIFLFSGWAYPNASLEVCKQSCASNCSCIGIVYDANKSVCLPMGDKVSLLNVNNHPNITGKNYVAYLKIAGNVVPTSPSRRRISTPALVAIGIIITLVFCLVLGFVTFSVTIRRAKHILPPDLNQEEEDQLQDILPLLPSRFSYQDLHEATQAFSKLLGTGGCGSVYAGVLPDGRKVAVKRLESMATGHQSKTFLAEVAAIGRTSHHNIVRLVGFCLQLSSRLLVYEYVERGSLDQWLFKEAQDGRAMLDWATRYDVALGIARGLNYLHEDCPQPILHLDIKPQNILLDNAFVAKLADFGMSRVMERDMSQVVTGVRGTPGYIAPEWHLHGGVGKKCDVYSMGMVMLEMVAGRRNVDFGLLDTEASEQWHFPSWAARECEGGRMMELVDQRLQRAGVDEEQARRLMNAAFWCIQEDPSVRPSAFTVLQWLEGTVPFRQPPFSSASHVNSAAKPQSFSISLASFSGTH